MQLFMQLMVGDLLRSWRASDLCQKEIQFGIPFMSKGIQNIKKNCNRAKKYQKWYDRAVLWEVYVYLFSSTSMQKENPVVNSIRQIKLWCAKYKFAEGSHNFLMQSLMQLMVGDLWDLDEFKIWKIHFGIPFGVSGHPKDAKKIATQQKSTRKWFDRAIL